MKATAAALAVMAGTASAIITSVSASYYYSYLGLSYTYYDNCCYSDDCNSAAYYYSCLGLSYTYYDNCCYSDDSNSAATTAVATAAVAAAVIAYAW